MKGLVADDEQIARVTLQTLLEKRGYDVVVALDGSEALKVLEEAEPPAMVILDWMMPGIDGIELCRRIRGSPNGAYTYIIIVSGHGEKRHFKVGMEAGADDYLSKPFDGEELYLRVRAGERIVTLQKRLREEARVDALTGTLNRAAIMGVLQRSLAHATRHEEPVAVLLADLDNFKHVNDAHGHPVGDAVLQHVTRSMRTPLRAYDALGRYGGEEFLIIAPSCTTDEAATLAERVRRSVEASPFSHASGVIPLTVSIGVAAGFGEQLQPKDLVVFADNALYSAKRNGRNRVEMTEATPAVFDVRS